MGVFTDGSKYGVPEGICYSLPCKCTGGEWSVVEGLPLDDFSKSAMAKTQAPTPIARSELPRDDDVIIMKPPRDDDATDARWWWWWWRRRWW